MKNLKYYFKIKSGIWIVLLLSIGTVLTIQFEFFEITEPFKGGYKFELIFEKLAYAFITSFIFYYLLIFLPTVKERKSFEIFVQKELRDFYLNFANIVSAFYGFDKGNIKNGQIAPDADLLKPIFEKAQSHLPGNQTDVNMVRLTIWEQMWRMMHLFEESHKRILLRNKLYIPELADCMMKVESCTMFFMITQFGPSVKGLLMKDIFEPFWELHLAIEELSEHAYKEFQVPPVKRFYTSEKT